MFTLVKKFGFSGSHVLNGDTQVIQEHRFEAIITFACTELDENDQMFNAMDLTSIINEMREKMHGAMLMNSDQYIAIHENLQAFVPMGTTIVNMGNTEPTVPNITKNIFDCLDKEISCLDVINDPFVMYVELAMAEEYCVFEKCGYGGT